MRSQANAVHRPSIVIDLVISHDEIRNHTVDQLVDKAEKHLRLQLEAAKRHIDDHPPAELTHALSEANRQTRRDR